MTDTTSSPLSDQMAGHLLVECLIAQGVTHAFGCQVKVIWPFWTVFTITAIKFSLSPAGKKAAQPTWQTPRVV